MRFGECSRRPRSAALALALSLLLCGCSIGTATTPAARAPAATQAPAPAPSGGKAGPGSLYPNPALTPGDTFPNATAREVCTAGYASSVRAVTSEEKAEVFRRYGIPDEAGRYEVDHFISLEIGGSNMLTNLWPEPYATPDAPGRIGAREKDKVENYLHDEVCKGALTLEQAQEQMRGDWYAVYLKIGKGAG